MIAPVWLKPSAAASYADAGKRQIAAWLKSGLKHSRLPNGRIRIKSTDLDEFLESFAVAPGDSEINKIVDATVADVRRNGGRR